MLANLTWPKTLLLVCVLVALVVLGLVETDTFGPAVSHALAVLLGALAGHTPTSSSRTPTGGTPPIGSSPPR